MSNSGDANSTNKIKIASQSLYDAAKTGDVASMKKFIEEGADIRYHNASEVRNMTIIMFHRFPNIVNNNEQYNKTALHTAVLNNHMDAVNMLIAHGADVNDVEVRNVFDFQRYGVNLCYW